MNDHYKKPVIYGKGIIYSVFVLGLLTAIALRALIIFVHLRPEWVRPVWYFAVLGNFVFFFHRYRISRRRQRAIKNFDLIRKTEENPCMDNDDKEVTIYILRSVERSLENYNYLIIFIFSIIAIAMDLALDYFGG